MWSLGVLTFILLSGSRPFNERQVMEMQRGQIHVLRFPSNRGWDNVSDSAKDFLRNLLVKEPKRRMDSLKALNHPWFSGMTDSTAQRRYTAASQQPAKRVRRHSSRSKHRAGNSNPRSNSLHMKAAERQGAGDKLLSNLVPQLAKTMTPTREELRRKILASPLPTQNKKLPGMSLKESRSNSPEIK